MALVNFEIVNAADMFGQCVSIRRNLRTVWTLENRLGFVVRRDMTIQSSQILIGTTAYLTIDSWLLDIAVIF